MYIFVCLLGGSKQQRMMHFERLDRKGGLHSCSMHMSKDNQVAKTVLHVYMYIYAHLGQVMCARAWTYSN
jgi:hypothetical protein